MRNIRIHHKTVTVSVYIIVSFVVTTLIVWLINNLFFSVNLQTKYRLATFVNRYEATLKKNVFEDVFSAAETCNTFPIKEEIMSCQKAVGIQIGNVLAEEELADRYYWPHDLFFVKQQGTSFLQVGWDGELKDISSKVTTTHLTGSQSLVSLLFRKDCNYFNIDTSSYACEVYEKIPLDNESYGYVVRMFPYLEESSLFFSFFMPAIGVMMLSDIQHRMPMDQGVFLFILLSFANVIVPFIVATAVLYRMKKKQVVVPAKIRPKPRK